VTTAAAPRRGRRLTLGRVVFAAIWVYLGIRLLPHLATLVGVPNADGTPRYRFESLAGGAIDSDSLRGKVVLVNVWATWCAPCRVEMPALQAMADRHRDRGLVVIGLSRDVGGTEPVRAFLAERGISYPVAVVESSAERIFGGVHGYPTSFLIDRAGRIRQRAMGPLAMVSFEPAVRRLLKEPADSAYRGQ
jgi:thiol-disulfide isomerase/thioredoxin